MRALEDDINILIGGRSFHTIYHTSRLPDAGNAMIHSVGQQDVMVDEVECSYQLFGVSRAQRHRVLLVGSSSVGWDILL